MCIRDRLRPGLHQNLCILPLPDQDLAQWTPLDPASGRPGGQGGDPDARLGGLTLGPVVSIEPDLDRVREVCTDFDEARAEVLIPQVEVVCGDPPVGLGPGEVRRATLGADRAEGGAPHFSWSKAD